MVEAFANIYMASIEKEILLQSVNKTLTWKKFIDDVFSSLWDANKEEIEHFIDHADSYHPTIKLTAEVSQLGTTFLDTTVYKGERFEKETILVVRTHYKHTETFQYTNYNSCHLAGVKKRLRERRSSTKPATHLAILYADRGDRRKSPGMPGGVIAIFVDRRDRRIKSPISCMSDIGD